MSAHATVEMLSAYLDEELTPSEASRLEEHVEACGSCRARLQGMRNVVSTLHHLERMAPPPTLNQVVARRVALAGEEQGLLDRIEQQLDNVQRQSPIFFLFALTIALAVIVLLFAQAVERHQNATIPVIFEDLAPAEATAQQVIAGRTFYLVDAPSPGGDRGGETLWVEEGADPAAVDVILSATSPMWAELVAEEVELAELTELNGPVVVRLAGHTVRLEPADSP